MKRQRNVMAGALIALVLVAVSKPGWSEHEGVSNEQRVKEAMKYAPQYVESVARAETVRSIHSEFIRYWVPVLHEVAAAGKKVRDLRSQLWAKVQEVKAQLRVVRVSGVEAVVQLDEEKVRQANEDAGRIKKEIEAAKVELEAIKLRAIPLVAQAAAKQSAVDAAINHQWRDRSRIENMIAEEARRIIGVSRNE